MSSSSRRSSRRSSPQKEDNSNREHQEQEQLPSPSKRKNRNIKEEEAPENISVIDEPVITSSTTASTSTKATSLKLRLKVKEASSTLVEGDIPTPASLVVVQDETIDESARKAPKMIKLNFSRSSDSVISSAVPPVKQRGRPKKDKTAVKAAALAASQPNELESEERRGRRRAAEEKIKQSVAAAASVEASVIVETRTDSADGEDIDSSISKVKKRRGRRPKVREDGKEEDSTNVRRRRRRSQTTSLHSSSSSSLGSIDGGNAGIVISTESSNQIRSIFNPHENDFVQRSKTFLNIALQHETFLYNSVTSMTGDLGAFSSISDAVERVVPFHLGITAGQYSVDELSLSAQDYQNMDNADNDQNMEASSNHLYTLSTLQDRYRSIIHAQSSKQVPTELLLLEQRLCLEEEKFLLVKLKNEYTAKFLRNSSSTSSSAQPSRSNSVLNS